MSINGRAGIAIWPGPGPSNASGTIRISVPVSAWKTGSNTLAFTHSQYIAGRVDALSVSFTTTSPPSTTSTTPPSTPTTPPPPPLVSTTGSATLSWTLGTSPGLAGYNVYVGTSSGVYNYPGSPFNTAVVNTYTISNLPKGQTYFFALTAFDTAGNKSVFSAEVSKSIY